MTVKLYQKLRGLFNWLNRLTSRCFQPKLMTSPIKSWHRSCMLHDIQTFRKKEDFKSSGASQAFINFPSALPSNLESKCSSEHVTHVFSALFIFALKKKQKQGSCIVHHWLLTPTTSSSLFKVGHRTESLSFISNKEMIMDFLFSDKLGSTVFAPVKMDFVGNIKVRVHVINPISLFNKINDYILVLQKWL